MTSADLLGRIVSRLEAAGIPAMLTGSFAIRTCRMEKGALISRRRDRNPAGLLAWPYSTARHTHTTPTTMLPRAAKSLP